MKTTSRFALIAAAGVLFGAAFTPAKAADLGGGCCADLEERVAELEATTARKGNRVVSLQVYGQVNKALMIYDNGIDSDALVVDNYDNSSRLGFTGKATIKPGLTAGYMIEFDLADSSSNAVNEAKINRAEEDPDDPRVIRDGDENSVIQIRHNNWYLESERLGRITVGLGSTAADGAAEVVLGNSLKSSNVQVGNGLHITVGDLYSNGTLGDVANNLDGGRNQVIRYDTPSIYGFIASASWGDNDYADVALRFKKEFNSVRVAAAVAYSWDTQGANVETVGGALTTDVESETLVGSISVMHVPTGLYAAFAAGNRDNEDADLGDQSFWYVQAGIEKKFVPYGSTTIYGEYGQYDRDRLRVEVAGDKNIVDVETERFGFGVVQKIDAAAMDIYAQASFWNFEGDDGDEANDMTTVMVGSRIKF